MAKRLTDTTKWDRKNFRELSPKLKLVWLYLLDECDHAGVWHEDYEQMAFKLGVKVTREELFAAFGTHLCELDGNRLFLPAFIDFQYGEINESSSMHRTVVRALVKHGLWNHESRGISTLPVGQGYSTRTLRVGYKEKDKEKEKEWNKEERGGVGEKTKLDFEVLYKKYPLKKGKSKGLKICQAQIRTQEDHEKLSRAIDRYSELIATEGTEPKYIKHFSTFMGGWRDYLDDDVGACAVKEVDPFVFLENEVDYGT